HSTMQHAILIAKMANKRNIEVFVHAITDGRDVAPDSAAGFIDQFVAECGQDATVATIMGRYYAMDRDLNIERTKIAVNALIGNTDGDQLCSNDEISNRIRRLYEAGEYDEFIRPIVFGREGRIQDGDTVLMFNFRADRMIQICKALSGNRDIECVSDCL